MNKQVIFNDFKKGLNTDQNSFNQDPNTIIDIDNFIITDKGTVKKRKGLKKTSLIDMELTTPDILDNKSVSTYLWNNIDRDLTDILIVQYGTKLYFYEYENGNVISKFPAEVLLSDYLTSTRLLEEDISLQFTQIKNRVVCTYKQMTPFTLTYNNSYSIHIQPLNLFTRDTLDSSYDYSDTSTRPVALEFDHMYKLFNGGWEYFQMYYIFDKTGELPALSERPSDFAVPFNQGDIELYQYLVRQIDLGKTKPTDNDDLENFRNTFDARNVVATDTFNTVNNINASNPVGYMDISTWGDGPNTNNYFKLGKSIINVYDTDMCNNYVYRPILEAPETDIDRSRWNSYHLLDELKDIFLHDNKVHMVVKFDKEHDLEGGKSQSLSGINVSFNVSHRDVQNQVKMESGLGSRIYSYNYSPILMDALNLDSGDVGNKAYDEGLYFTDFSTRLYTNFRAFYGNASVYPDLQSWNNDGKTRLLIRNLTTNPFDYKAMNFENYYYAGVVPGHASVNREWQTTALPNISIETDNYEPGYYYSDSRDRACSLIMPSGFWTKKEEGTSVYYYKFSGDYSTTNITSVTSKGVFGYVGNMIINSYSENCNNYTPFDISHIKYTSDRLEEELVNVKIDTEVELYALSDKTAILVFQETAFDAVHPDWLFNVDEEGNLICFDEIYNSFKLKLSDTLYNKQMKVYEDYKRNEYASNKLDEEYALNDDYYSVKNIIQMYYRPSTSSVSTLSTKPYHLVHPNIVIELNKDHNKAIYRALGQDANADGYFFENINLIQGNFNEYINPAYDFLLPRQDTYNNATRNTNLRADWGENFSDYAYTYKVPNPIKLKDYDELKDYVKPIFDIYNNAGIKMPFTFFAKDSMRGVDASASASNFRTYFNNVNGQSNLWDMGIGHRLYMSPVWEGGHTYNSINDLYRSRSADDELRFLLHQNELLGLDTALENAGWKVRYNINGVTDELAPNNKTGDWTGYKMYTQSRYSGSGGYTQAEVDNGIKYTTFDYIKCIEMPMNYNYDITKKQLQEQQNVEFIGNNYIWLSILPTFEQYTYDDSSLTTKTLDSGIYQIPTTKASGEMVNFYQDVKFWKFSLRGTLDQATIQAKFNAYRLEWDWSMDIGNGEGGGEIEIDPDNLTYERIIERFRPRDCVALGGRLFLAGIDTPDLSRTIFFSQLVEGDVIRPKIEMSYSVNDPTDIDLNSPLATDGGYVSIEGVDKVIGIEVINSMLIIIASNGVWALYGGNGYFDPTNYIVKQISTIGCISRNSINVIDNQIIYCGEYSINVLEPTTADLNINPIDMTNRRIDKLYNSIPLASKRNIRTEYDTLKNIYYILYRDTEEGYDKKNHDFNSILIYNLNTDSFFKFSFNNSSYLIKDIFIDNYNVNELIRLKFVVSDGDKLDIYDLSSDLFKDYDIELDYEASLKTAGQIATVASGEINGGKLITHFNNNDNSSCLASFDFDFNHINKKSQEREIFKVKTDKEVVFNKQHLRGEGGNMNISYRSPAGYDCEILGFELNLNIKNRK